ncbi:MAG: methylated-DNA--[protein]-cysteine S-methyltransferase [Lachnospiraceae bacterium]|nr:methylated-DNA--[protein]-cysteine S-methyltransferase [Lachnospiraceae bacterium]
MKSREEAAEYGLTFPDTYQDMPFHDTNWLLIRYKGNKKAFLWIYERDGFINMNVKVDPDKACFWRDIYKSVIPGYHQNKDHWNTIILDGSIPENDIKQMVSDSYELIAISPSKRIYEAVKQIPYGFVATYAQVAQAAGDRKMARAVGNALHKNPDPENIPCFKVVNSKGELAGEFAFGGAGEQAKLLEKEGIEVTEGKVDLKKYQWEKYK